MVEPKQSESQKEPDDEKEEREKGGVPVPPARRKHRRKHWDHLPGQKRKSIRSYKSPGRK